MNEAHAIQETPSSERPGDPVKPVKPSWGQVIATLALLLAIVGAISYGAFLVAYPLGWLARPESRLATFLVGAILGELAALAALVGLLRRRGWRLLALGLGKATNWRGLALGLAVAVVYAGMTATLNPAVGPNLLRFTLVKGLAIIAAIVAGLVEETIFRGYLMTSLDQLGRGRVTQVLVSGVAFAVAHFYGFVSPAAILATFGFTFILGAALALTYLVGNRSLTPVILSHAIIDLIIEPWLLLGFFTGAA